MRTEQKREQSSSAISGSRCNSCPVPLLQCQRGSPMKTPSPDPRPRLLAVARELASQRGWRWLEPVETNCQSRGMSIRIVIREADDAIVQAGYLPR
jgi:hypothetical protein